VHVVVDLSLYYYEFVYDSFFMVECYSSMEDTMKYYGNMTSPGAHFPFNFLLITSFNQQSNAYDVYDMIKSWMINMPENKWPNWVVSDWYYIDFRHWGDIIHRVITLLRKEYFIDNFVCLKYFEAYRSFKL